MVTNTDLIPGRVINVWHEHVAPAEFLAHMRALSAKADYLGAPRAITDGTTATGTADLTPEVLDEAAAILIEHASDFAYGRRVAFVFREGYGAAQTFERLLRKSPIGLVGVAFNHLDHACEWLGVDTAAVKNAIATLRAGLAEG